MHLRQNTHGTLQINLEKFIYGYADDQICGWSITSNPFQASLLKSVRKKE